ncbi:MAG: helix-turn-helix transcriptional regulator [Rhodobacterales bacterium]|nr:helix-turn-helix transcriptional regulator [Rhodobacterales bacterium]
MQEKARGQAFSAWMRHAIDRKGWSGRRLAEEIGCSPSSLSLYLRGGWDEELQRVRRPREQMVEQIAAATGASATEGRRAAGYLPRGEAVHLPERIAALPPDAMSALLNFLDVLEAARPS